MMMSHTELVWALQISICLVVGVTYIRKRHSEKRRLVGTGVGALVLNGEGTQVLMGLRKGSHGAGTWALPGGWLEVNEEFTQCALREVFEETGLRATDLSTPTVLDVAACNNIFPKVHSVSVFVAMRLISNAEPRVTEPDKCGGWTWFPLHDPSAWPENLFSSARYVLNSRAIREIVHSD